MDDFYSENYPIPKIKDIKNLRTIEYRYPGGLKCKEKETTAVCSANNNVLNCTAFNMCTL
jgi:hypothetical protein